MERKSPEEYIQEDIAILTRKRNNLQDSYDQLERDLKALPDRYHEERRNNAVIVESQQQTILAAKNRIDKLVEEENSLEETIQRHKKEIRSFQEKHAEIAKNLLAKESQLYRNIDDLTKQESDLIIRKDVAQKALDDLIGLRISTDSEHDHIRGSIKERRNELMKIQGDLDILFSKRKDADRDLLDQREAILNNQDREKELAIRLHDVEVLELRLKPEFQTLLKSYLANRG